MMRRLISKFQCGLRPAAEPDSQRVYTVPQLQVLETVSGAVFPG
jgi:hypothetical protein